MFALQDVVIKDMSQGYPVHQIIVLRAAVGLPILLGIVLMTSKYPFLGAHPNRLDAASRRSNVFRFRSLLPGVVDTTVNNGHSAFLHRSFLYVAFFYCFAGRESQSESMVGCSTGFLGALIILRPDRSGFNLIGMLPILAAMFYAGCQVLTRHKVSRQRPR
ncbi:MAG: hypothetical protein CM1200mP41_08090 [Gammaproteobacteria bacterium]|nr:MAG: hypothetical protein CM1200mP41_08090 [Gammaproteobacteria bacterium]